MTRTYTVELIVYGQCTTKDVVNFDTEKELDFGNVFNSSITIRKHSHGLIISSTVSTKNQDQAYKVGLLFVGQMLDVLSLRTNLPLNVTYNKYVSAGEKNSVNAVINKNEFQFCFEFARELNLNYNKLLRAFSWYRKGLHTEDPFDKFLAFWNSISVVAEGYCISNERTRLGTRNKIFDCFTQLWGDCQNWQHIGGDLNWIENNHEIRNKIAHGGVTVDIRYIENVINQLETVQRVAYSFLTQWVNKVYPEGRFDRDFTE